MAVIWIEKGKRRGQSFEVPDAALPTVLGRDAGADIIIEDERASRQHARILRRFGSWVVEDLGSRNGILYQGAMVRRAVIQDGDAFQIGSTVLKLREAERIDPLSGMELQGSRLQRLLHDEGGILSYQAQQLAMDRQVRVDVLHPRWMLLGETAGDDAEPSKELLLALQGAARAAAGVQHPRVNPLLRAEMPDERGGGFAVLRWSEAPRLVDVLPEFLKLSLAIRIQCVRRLAEAVLARAAEPLGHPIGLRHVLIDPQEGPLIQALELPALFALLKGQAAHLPAFPPFLAPEQAVEGAGPSRAAAVYNLAAIGYLLLTRLPPMGEGTVEEILERHRSLPPAPADLACPEVPPALARMLSRMMEKDPALRPAGAGEILEALTHAEPAEPARAEAPVQKGPGRATPRRPLPAAAGREVPRMPPVPAGGERPPPRRAPGPAGPRIGERGSRMGEAPPPEIRPPASDMRLAAPRHARMPLLVHLIFWPALWCGLVLGGRELMKAILERMGG